MKKQNPSHQDSTKKTHKDQCEFDFKRDAEQRSEPTSQLSTNKNLAKTLSHTLTHIVNFHLKMTHLVG